MTVAVGAPERRAPRRRAVWAVLLGILPLAIAGTALAGAGALPLSTTDVAAPVASPSPDASSRPAPGDETASSGEVIEQIAAPGTLEGADYSSSIQQITVKFPPPPEPPASAGGSRGGGGSRSGGGSGAPINYKTWCANNGPAYSASSASSMLTAINNERARNGAPALSANSTLAANAAAYSAEMAERRNNNPDVPFGGDLNSEFYKKIFYHSSNPGAAENLFTMSSGSSWSWAHSALMESNGHCNNIMNPALKTFGVGVASAADGSWYLTQRFGR